MDCRSIPWLKILRVLGILSAIAIMVISIYDLVTAHPEIKGVVNNIYRCIFGQCQTPSADSKRHHARSEGCSLC